MWHLPPFATVARWTRLLALLIAGVGVIAPGAASGAAWVAEGLAIAPSDSVQSDAVVASDGQGGAFVAWQDYRSGGISIFVQRVLADGTIAPGWPAGGMALGAVPDPVILADGLGGVFVAAADGIFASAHVWHVSADGTLNAQSFNEPAAAVAPSGHDPSRTRGAGPFDTDKQTPTVLPVLCSDGAGGAFLAWEEGGLLITLVRVQHLLPGGDPDPAWPAGGASAAYGIAHAPVLCGDGGSGVYVGFLGYATSGLTLRAQHLDGHGAAAPGWPDGGVPADSAAGGEDAPAIVADGAGGALLLWQETSAPGHTQLRSQRVTADAAIAPGWPAAGRTLSTSAIAGEGRYSARGLQLYTSAVPDGAGGVIVAWQDARADSGDIYAQHLLSDGSFTPGWPVDGLALSTAPGSQRLPSLAPDGSGGAFAAWQDEHGAGRANIHAQHVSGAGVMGWASDGVALTATSADQVLPRVVGDGAGGALITWQDTDCGAAAIFASHVGADGSVPSAHGPGSVIVTPLAASADSGQIRVSWQLASSALPGLAVVYCRQLDTPWTAIDTVAVDASGRILYADRGAIAGCRYGYALGVTNCGRARILGVTWIDVPQGSGFLPIALVATSMQPDSGHLQLAWRLNGGEHLAATVFRRDSCTDWVRMGVATVDDSSRVSLVDASPEYVGTRRLYRLVVHVCGADVDLGESWTPALQGPGTVPVYASLTSAVADSGTAVLDWRLAFEPPELATLVERSDPGGDWISRGAAAVGAGRLQFRDTGLLASHRYEFRLSLFVCVARTTFPAFAVVTGGAPSPSASLSLLSVGPNPAGGALTLSLSVPYDEPVRLQLLDLSGRSVLERSVEPTSTDAQSVVFDGLGALRPGMYMLRVTQHGVSRSRRVVIVR